MSYENLRLTRNILYRIFAIGIVITLLMLWATIGGWATWTSVASTWLHTDATALMPIVIGFFMSVRFFLLYIVLIPALAIHWTICKEQK